MQPEILRSPVFGPCVMHAGQSRRTKPRHVRYPDGGTETVGEAHAECNFNMECARGMVDIRCKDSACECALDPGLKQKPATFTFESPGACDDSGQKLIASRCLPWQPPVAATWEYYTPSVRWTSALDASTD